MNHKIEELQNAYNKTRSDYEKLLIKDFELEKERDHLLRMLERCDLEKKYLLAEDDRKNRIIKEIMSKPHQRAYNLAKKVLKSENIYEKYPPVAPPELENLEPKIIAKELTNCYEDNVDFSKYSSDIKPLAFYLPQYHTFPENDKWWGKGFTEWTNVKAAKPLFKGHNQPRVPHDDFGYYTLTDKDIFQKQIKLAKQHGVYGFSFYYYWFSGKRLMEKPLDLWLKNKDLDFPFCLCWANENWTRTWDGKEKDVLISQQYTKDDPKKFIRDIKDFLLDPRYIRVNGKPILLIYEPHKIPNSKEAFKLMKEEAKKIGIGEILIWSRNITFGESYTSENIDAEFDFFPNGFRFINRCPSDAKTKNGSYYDYKEAVLQLDNYGTYKHHFSTKPYYYSVAMGWDNSSRRKNNFATFYNYSPRWFYYWLKIVIDKTRAINPPDQRFIFINAWNEWAEGTYLEPDKKLGYANINTLSRAIFNLPYDKDTVIINDLPTPTKNPNYKIALQAHIFYTDLADEIFTTLNKISLEYDLYITTDSIEKKRFLDKALESYNLKANHIKIEVYKNKGRDILPFLKQMEKVYKKYDIIGHIHSKKSLYDDFGDSWRKYQFSQLLGSSHLKKIFALFNQKNIGLVYPSPFYKIDPLTQLGSNLDQINSLLEKMGLSDFNGDEDTVKFPASSMFWARTKAIQKIFELNLSDSDFPDEQGQIDQTTAHAVERLFGIVPEKCGYKIMQFYNKD